MSEVTLTLRDLTMKLSRDDSDKNVVCAESRSMGRKALDSLWQSLRSTLAAVAPRSHMQSFRFGVAVLRVAEDAVGSLFGPFEAAAKTVASAKPAKATAKTRSSEGWSANSIITFADILQNDHGLDLSTVDNTARELLGGQSLEDVCKSLPSWLRILDAKPVFRQDSWSAFWSARQQSRQAWKRSAWRS